MQVSRLLGGGLRTTLALVIALLAGSAAAQNPPSKPPPRCVEPVYRQFDFWIGEWTVTSPDGQTKLGESLVTREEDGCLIVEHWRSAKGGHGQSYNFYDPSKKAWRQVWASPTELTDYSGALNAKGEMVLEGLSQQAGGAKQRSLGTWTASADGAVTQTFKSWDEKKKVWVADFTGVYRKKP